VNIFCYLQLKLQTKWSDGESEEQVAAEAKTAEEAIAGAKTLEKKNTIRTLVYRTPEGIGRVGMCMASSSMNWSNCHSSSSFFNLARTSSEMQGLSIKLVRICC
jgi:hypothetical protein